MSTSNSSSGNAWANETVDTSASEVAPIADRSYRNYDGPLITHGLRWWKISLALIRANVNKSRLAFWVPVAIVILTYLVRTVAFYFSQSFRAGLTAQGMPMPPDWDNPYAASLCNSMSEAFICLNVFIAAIVVGAASIAADNRANALLVYLSKPITRFDYLFGKWMGIFILLYAMVLVPSLLMLLFFIAAYSTDGFLHTNAILIPKVLLAAAIPAAIHASLIVGFSAWSKSARVTGASYAAFYLILNTMVLIIGNQFYATERKGTGSTAPASMMLHGSVFGIQAALAQHIYAVPPPQSFNSIASGRRIQRAQRREEQRRKRQKDQGDLPDPNGQTEQSGSSGADNAGQPAGQSAEQPFWETEKPLDSPPLWFVLALGGAYVGIPLAAAAVKVRAVEVIRG